MNPDIKKNWITTSLLFICVTLFVVQIITGVSPTNPHNEDLYRWGANWLFSSFTLEPWRMLSSVFLHIGFMHIAFNMYALHMFGYVSEQLYGKWFYLLVFLLSGIGGNMLNNSVTLYEMTSAQTTSAFFPALSAGASGGIMGLGGALLVCSLLNVEHNNISLRKKTLLWLMGINLMIGMVIPNIDNLGHIGGALTGGAMAFMFALGVKFNQLLLSKLLASMLVVTLFAGGYLYVSSNYATQINQLFERLERAK